MRLAEYLEKDVIIEDPSGAIWNGHVSDYIEADDNESGKESIIMDSSDGRLIEFEPSDIATITVA